jgi:ribonuclease HI
LSASDQDSKHHAKAWIDGASRGNPGAAGFGVYFEDGNGVEEVVGFLGQATNNVAEYAGLIAALTLAQRHGVASLTVFSDSQLLVRQVEGTYKVKAPHLVPIFLKVLQLRQALPSCQIRHVRREENREADRLANQAIDTRAPPPSWLEIEVLPG